MVSANVIQDLQKLVYNVLVMEFKQMEPVTDAHKNPTQNGMNISVSV